MEKGERKSNGRRQREVKIQKRWAMKRNQECAKKISGDVRKDVKRDTV